ncbi:MAG TPA: N-acetylmuramoyl-L-alanine amidase [Thermoanaerobaculia bacterium]|nr:N-acetylmuramoyl-L-alanine amidase [Thermoanaerobaculia bacterium]
MIRVWPWPAGLAAPALALAVLAAVLAAPAGAAPLRKTVPATSGSGPGDPPDPMVAVLTDGHEIFLEAKPQPGEGLYGFALRLCGDREGAAQVAGANAGADRLLAGVRYRVPYDCLRNELKVRVATALFADDRAEPAGWRHRVRGVGGLGRESLWHVALWFTGRGENFPAIREHNGLVEDEVAAGRELVIPSALLLPGFRQAVARSPDPSRPQVALAASPPAAVPQPPPALPRTAAPTPAALGTAERPYRLEYRRDARGEVAVYRLAPGEALYSSVVVRFIGAVLAPDVNALAAEIAERSGIRDVTDIPIGHEVKIPLELLLPEYLPAAHPRRREYEAALRESGRFTNQVHTADLSGVTVILDAGHGGVDVGASIGGVWESLYVYDIKLRIKALLERHTAARVVATTRDGEEFRILDRDVLPFSRGHQVLTNPPYPIADSAVGVNLRWYLANSAYSRAVSAESDPQKVVFLSIHADSLHPSLRGAMAYIPAAAMRQGSFRKAGAVYEARQEWRERPAVSFAWQERVESEGLSRQLAEEMIAALDRRGVAIHPHKPVREKIVRNRSEFVPAVLRYNSVPAKILLEVCNLANGEDRKLLQTRSFRQQTAEAVVEAILRYYGQGEGLEDSLRVAAAGAG